MLAVSASCSLLTLPYQHHNLSPCSCLLLSFFFFPVFFSLSSSSFFLSSPVSLLLLPLSSSPVFFPCLLPLSSSPVFFCCSSPSSPGFFFCCWLQRPCQDLEHPGRALLTHAHAVVREASQTTEGFTAQDACKTHQLFADDRLVARYAQNLFTARISQLLGHCFRALYTLS